MACAASAFSDSISLLGSFSGLADAGSRVGGSPHSNPLLGAVGGPSVSGGGATLSAARLWPPRMLLIMATRPASFASSLMTPYPPGCRLTLTSLSQSATGDAGQAWQGVARPWSTASAAQRLTASRRRTIRHRFSNGIYCWYSFGTELRYRAGTVPLSTEWSISCCRVIFFFAGFLSAVFFEPAAGSL